MKKQKAILNLSRKSVTEVVTKGGSIILKMTGNATFPTPMPELNSIQLQIDVVNSKLAEQKEAFKTYQQKTVELENEKDNLIGLLELLGNYVNKNADGDVAKILSAGYDVKKASTPAGLLPSPLNVLAKEGANSGDIVVSWKSMKGAKSYLVDMTYDVSDEEQWTFQAAVVKAKCFISGIDSGTRVWVRVSAVNSAGQGAYSDPATKVAP
ncbi:MAG: fibronectin type III domain-containing protein [Chitinophagales bacterium]